MSQQNALQWRSSAAVGLLLGLGLTTMSLVLFLGSRAQGDLRLAWLVGAPAMSIGAVGTLLYAALPRTTIRWSDRLLHVNDAPWHEAHISSMSERGEGFTTTRAFRLRSGDRELWVTRWSFRDLDAMHHALAERLPVEPAPAVSETRYGRLIRKSSARPSDEPESH